MKKGLIGVLAVGGALLGFRVAARRMGRTMREHCGEMAAHCKQMAVQFGGRGESVGKT